MSVVSRPVTTGKTRTCPHCKATILESLSICPGCMHHLRFDSEAAKRQVAAAPALRVEGIIRHPALDEPLEYYVIIAIRNDRGEEITRQVVNVGALQAAEKRSFTLSVEVLPPQEPAPAKSNASTSTFKTPPQTQPGATIRPPSPSPSPSPSPPATTATPMPATTPTQSMLTQPAPPASGATTAVPAATSAKTSAPTSSSVTDSVKPPQSGRLPANPTSGPKPGGYPGSLKPPNPGGPKRH